MTLIGFIPLVIMSLLNWATIPIADFIFERTDSFNIFSLWSRSNEIKNQLSSFGVNLQDYSNYMTIVTIVLVVLLSSFALLLLSLVIYKSKFRATIAYWGFGLNALVSIAFVVAILWLNYIVNKESSGYITSVISLTPIPYLAFAFAVIAMFFFVKRPVITHSEQRKAKKSRFPYYVIIPMLILLLLFVAVPIVGSFIIAFFDYNPLRPASANRFVGFQNFATLFTDGIFHTALFNTLYYVFVMVSINLCFTLIVAQILCSLNSNRWRSVFRVNFFMPCVAPLAAVALVWGRTILTLKGGSLNMLIGLIGIPPVNWTSASMLMPSLILLSLWADVGYNIILFIAGIQSIPHDFMEAALIDGAGPFHRFFKVTLPLLGRTLTFVIAMTFISQFQAFAQFSIMASEGGAGRAGYVLSTFIYNIGFKYNKDFGYASAISLVLFALIMIVTTAQRKLSRVDWGY